MMSIDALVVQWKDQWDAFYEKETSDMEATNAFWKEQWSKWFNAQTEEIQQSYLEWEKQWDDWYASQTADMQETNTYWKQLWASWFNEYTNDNTSEMAAWRENAQALFDEWFQQLKDTLSEDVEANLANQILELQERTKILEEIVVGIPFLPTCVRCGQCITGQSTVILRLMCLIISGMSIQEHVWTGSGHWIRKIWDA